MITILISGPQGCAKTQIAKMFIKTMRLHGFVAFRVYTTNEDLQMPATMREESE